MNLGLFGSLKVDSELENVTVLITCNYLQNIKQYNVLHGKKNQSVDRYCELTNKNQTTETGARSCGLMFEMCHLN